MLASVDIQWRAMALVRQASDGARRLWRMLAQRSPTLRRLDGWAAATVALAVALRLALVVLGWLSVNSDEGTIGLEAMHIAFRGEHPIFFYGQNYMGVLEAYLAALSFRLFGVSTFDLRLGLILLYAIFLVAVYVLARTLYDRRVARVSALLLALGSPAMFFRQLQAMGGEVETICFGALVLMFAARLALSAGAPVHHPHWRALIFAAWGLAAGLGLWSSLLVAPLVLASALLLAVGCRREIWGRMGLSLAVGLIVGAYPLIAYNLTAAPGQDSLQVFLTLDSAGGSGRAVHGMLLLPRVTGTLFVSMPYVLGAAPFCPLSVGSMWPLTSHSSAIALQCAAARGGWSLAWLALWIVSLALCVHALMALWPKRHAWSVGERAQVMRRAGQLAVLVGAGLTLVVYAQSLAPALVALDSSRYLVGLWVATPAILAPLVPRAPRGALATKPTGLRLTGRLHAMALLTPGRWKTRDEATSAPSRRALPAELRAGKPLRSLAAWLGMQRSHLLAIGRMAVLAIALLVLCRGVLATFAEVSGARQIERADQVLIADFERLHLTHIFADYWTCDRIIFESRERISCAVLNGQLRPGLDRYPPYQRAVWNDPHPHYAFPLGSPQATLAARLATGGSAIVKPAMCSRDPNCRFVPGSGYSAHVIDGYVVYQ